MTRKRTRTRTADSPMSRRAALGLLFGGVGALGLQQSGAYSSTVGDRGVGASTAEDPEALLGLEANEDPATTPTITNNSSSTMSITLESESVEFDIDDNPFDLSSGDTKEFDVSGSKGDVIITAHLTDDNANTGSIELVREFVPAASVIEGINRTIKSPGGSSKYKFGLTNTGENPVKITRFGVQWTDPEADQIKPQGKGGNQATLRSGGLDLITETMHIGVGEDKEIINKIKLPGTKNNNEEVTFEFRRFRDDNGDRVKVEEVDLFVQLEGGSSTVVELRPED